MISQRQYDTVCSENITLKQKLKELKNKFEKSNMKCKEIKNINEVKNSLDNIKELGRQLVSKIVEDGITMTLPGSLTYLLFGSNPSRQSVSIKFGKIGEKLFIEMIKYSPHLKLLKCGVQIVDNNGKKRDVDLI